MKLIKFLCMQLFISTLTVSHDHDFLILAIFRVKRRMQEEDMFISSMK